MVVREDVRRLAEVTGSNVEAPWDVVQAKLGFELPSDYRDLLGPAEEVTAVAGFRPIEEREWLRFSDTRSPQVRKISLRHLDLT